MTTHAFRMWVESAVLGEPIAEWLAHWHSDPEQCLRAWVRRATTMPAKLLRGVEEEANQIHTGESLLLPHAERDVLFSLAQNIAESEDFDRAPTIGGRVCETGVWTRLGYSEKLKTSFSKVWLRLGARVAELVGLTGEATHKLALGAVMLAPGESLAWCEMARGLLIHWVRLEDATPLANIWDYRVVAPTEWNFHPSGVVAKALAAMPHANTAQLQAQVSHRIGILAAAFDPCVNYKIEFNHA